MGARHEHWELKFVKQNGYLYVYSRQCLATNQTERCAARNWGPWDTPDRALPIHQGNIPDYSISLIEDRAIPLAEALTLCGQNK
jgi:hypothetical protein